MSMKHIITGLQKHLHIIFYNSVKDWNVAHF